MPYNPPRGIGRQQDDIEVRLARMSERSDAFASDFTVFVTTVNNTFTDIRAALNSLNLKLEERGKAPWQLITGFGVLLLGVIGGLGTLAYAPIKDTETRLETAVARVAEGAVTGKEFATYIANNTERRATVEKFQTDRMDRIGAYLNEYNNKTIEKDVYAADIRSEAERDTAMQREIDEVRNTVAGIYSPKDAVARSEKRIDDLETQITILTAKVAGVK